LPDEAIFSPKDAIELLEMEACDFINIKLAKLGELKMLSSLPILQSYME